jgi:hypothetical protein
MSTTRLADEDRALIRERMTVLTTEHHRNLARINKDFEAEHKRLADMLRLNCVPQMVAR